MAQFADREHYIPLRGSDLVALLRNQPGLTAEERENFTQFCRLLAATFHFEYHDHLERLKDLYAPFDPDAVVKLLAQPAAAECSRNLAAFTEQVRWLLERANYKKLDQAALDAALDEASAWGINMAVDFQAFEQFELYIRGDAIGTRYRRDWRKLWRKESFAVPIYQRVVVLVKFKGDRPPDEQVDTRAVFLKIFKDIPKVDLEMVLPGTKLQMPNLTKIKLGGSIVSGLGLILYQVATNLAQLLSGSLGVLLAPITALLGYGYKQYHGYATTFQAYSLQLTRSLYYHNLDNNQGVLFHLLNEAEEQEFREAILAYYYLWRQAGEHGWTSEELDDHVEQELERLVGLQVDFEIGDALDKLVRLKVAREEDGRFFVLPLDQALETLDHAWDNYFQYSQKA